MAKKKAPKKSIGKVSSTKSPKHNRVKGASSQRQRKISFPAQPSARKPQPRKSPTTPKNKLPHPKKKSAPLNQKFKRTYLYKQFKKKYEKVADKKYWKKIEKYWQTEYDKKKRPNTVVKEGITKKFVRTLDNRFQQTKKPYIGRTAWRKDKKTGKWKEGKPVRRYFWKDKLTGELLRGRAVGARMKKVIEPDLIRGYMKKHKLKNYQKARKRFLKETANTSIRTIVWLYGGSP